MKTAKQIVAELDRLIRAQTKWLNADCKKHTDIPMQMHVGGHIEAFKALRKWIKG